MRGTHPIGKGTVNIAINVKEHEYKLIGRIAGRRGKAERSLPIAVWAADVYAILDVPGAADPEDEPRRREGAEEAA